MTTDQMPPQPSVHSAIVLGGGSVIADQAHAPETTNSDTSTSETAPIQFRVRAEGAPTRRLRLAGARYTLGSGVGCSIRLEDPTLRPLHAVLIRDRNRILVRAYSVPFLINDVRVTEGLLEIGDVLRLGAYQFELLDADDIAGPNLADTVARSFTQVDAGLTDSSGLTGGNHPESETDSNTWQANFKAEAQAWRAKRDELQTLQSRCAERQRELDTTAALIRERQESLQVREDALRTQEQAAVEVHGEFERRHAELAKEMTELDRQREALRIDQDRLARRQADFEGKNQTQQSRIEDLVEQREHLRQRETENQRKLDDAREQLRLSQRQAEAASDAVKEMRLKFAGLNEQLLELSGQQESLQRLETSRTQQHREHTEKLAQEVEQAVAARDAAIVERDSSVTQLDAIASQLDAVAGERDAIAGERDWANGERDAAFEQRDSAHEERNAAFEERNAAYGARDAAVSQLDSAVSQRDEAQRQCAEAVAAKSEVVQELELRVRECEDAMSQRDEALAERDEAVSAKANSDAAHENLLAAQRGLTEAKEAAEAELAAAQEELRQAVAELRATQDGRLSGDAMVQAAQARCEQLEAVEEELQQQVERLQTDIATAREEAALLRRDCQLARDTITELESLVREHQDRHENDRTSWTHEVESLRQNVEQLSLDLATAEQQLSRLREDNQSLTQRLAGATDERDDYKSKWTTTQSERDAVARERDDAARERDNAARERDDAIEKAQAARSLFDRSNRDHDETLGRIEELESKTREVVRAKQESKLALHRRDDDKNAIAAALGDESDASDISVWPDRTSSPVFAGLASLAMANGPQGKSELDTDTDTDTEAELDTDAENNDGPLARSGVGLATEQRDASEVPDDLEVLEVPDELEMADAIELVGNVDQLDNDEVWPTYMTEPMVDSDSGDTAEGPLAQDTSFDFSPSTSLPVWPEISTEVDESAALESSDSVANPWSRAPEDDVVDHESPVAWAAPDDEPTGFASWRTDEPDDDLEARVGLHSFRSDSADIAALDDEGDDVGSLAQQLIRDLSAERAMSDDVDEQDDAPELTSYFNPADLPGLPTATDSSDASSSDELMSDDPISDHLTTDRDDDRPSTMNLVDAADDVGPAAVDDSPVDDDSIEAYMNRLLQRVQGGTTASDSAVKAVPAANPPVKTAPAKSEMNTASKGAGEPELGSDLDAAMKEVAKTASKTLDPIDPNAPMVPRSQAPEKARNLSAMRELANESARTAITRSVKSQTRDITMQAYLKFAHAGVALLCGVAAVCMVQGVLRFVAAIAALIFATISIREGFVLLMSARQRQALANGGASKPDTTSDNY